MGLHQIQAHPVKQGAKLHDGEQGAIVMRILAAEQVLQAYDRVSELYPHIPSLGHWRAWEYAAYRHHRLDGRILDLGCGDGRYFRLLWPQAANVVGVDMSPGVAELGRQSGVYCEVHVAPAHQVPEADASFDHVFANCSLEHMDHLDAVLAEIHRCLRPRGTLLCSVVTDRFVQWALLPTLISMAGFDEAAAALQREFIDYHHVANPFSVDDWVKSFDRSGLIAEEHIPILPKHNSGIFLLMDSLWHVKRAGGGEMGDTIFPFLATNANFPGAFRKILDGLLQMETDWRDCSGAVFLVRKRGTGI
jgi:ubiquinone/menaquinone biosynthesis C-methylase UbiE